MSKLNPYGAAAAGVLLGLFTVACGQRSAPTLRTEQTEVKAPPDESDKQLETVRALTPGAVADLEAQAAKNPDDVESRAKLLAFYARGHYPAETRRLMLWMIRRHPEGIAWGPRRFAPLIDPSLDPEGYQQGRQLWLPRLVQHHLPVAELRNAAGYFKLADATISQKLLMRVAVEDSDRADLGVGYYQYLGGGPAWKWMKALNGPGVTISVH